MQYSSTVHTVASFDLPIWWCTTSEDLIIRRGCCSFEWIAIESREKQWLRSIGPQRQLTLSMRMWLSTLLVCAGTAMKRRRSFVLRRYSLLCVCVCAWLWHFFASFYLVDNEDHTFWCVVSFFSFFVSFFQLFLTAISFLVSFFETERSCILVQRHYVSSKVQGFAPFGSCCHQERRSAWCVGTAHCLGQQRGWRKW